MSDMLASIINTVTSGNTVFAPKTSSADEQRFSDMLKEADRKQAAPATITASVSAPKIAAEKFMAYQHMSTAEKFRASYLAEKGLTEEELAAMSPEERLKIETDIAEKIKEKIARSMEGRTSS